MEHCIQTDTVKRLVKVIDGNGQPGLAKAVTEMSVKIENLSSDIKGLSGSVTELVKFQSESIGREKQGLTNRQRAAIYISGVLGVVSIIITILINIK
jgi:hypothetical protein